MPENEVLNNLVSRVFHVEDVTLGEPARGLIARYRGRLVNEDTVAAYDQLADAVRPVVTNFVMPGAALTLAVPVTTFTATDNTAVTGYLLTETSTAPAATAAGLSGGQHQRRWLGSGSGRVSLEAVHQHDGRRHD